MKKIILPVAMSMTVTAGALIMNVCQSNKVYEKAKIELNDATAGLSPNEYKELIKRPEGASSHKTIEAYRLKNIADSLKMKAAVERAYHEGAQMVRDSLKKTTN